jgi:hypothetical protein
VHLGAPTLGSVYSHQSVFRIRPVRRGPEFDYEAMGMAEEHVERFDTGFSPPPPAEFYVGMYINNPTWCH